jgi:hypothetical protein
MLPVSLDCTFWVLIGHAIMDEDTCIMQIAKTEDEHKEILYKYVGNSKYTLEKTAGATQNVQSRDTGNIGH